MLKKMTIFAATTLWLVSSLYAQSGSTLRGQVLDPGQDAMAGVTISITSEQMPGKKTTITDSEGNYVFLGLAPGIYEVEAQANGFKPIKKTGVQLRVGQTITLPITLEVGQVQGTVVVKASEDTPIIDTTNPENNFNVSGEFINKLPLSTRQSWEGLWFLVPGAVTIGTNGPDGVNYDPTINGASQRSNAYKLNGFEIGNAFTNQGWTTQFSTEAIQDVVIKTGGGDASSSLGQGGAVNVVTKSGGNKFSGSAGVFFQPKQFNWTNVPGGTSSTLTLYQPDLSFGGPILKDRLWFFTTYRNVLTNEGVPRSVTVLDRFRQFGLTPPDFEKLERSNRFTGKLSYRLNDDHSLTFNYLNDAGKVINSDAREQGTLESAVDILSGGGTYQIAWTGNLSPRLLLTAQYGYRRLNNTVNIKGGDDPARTLFETTIISAGNRAGSGATLLFYGNRSFGFATASRGLRPHHEVTSDLTYITNLKGQHTFQVGLQFKPESRIESFNVLPASGLGLVEETLVNGQRVPFHRQFRNPIEYPSIVGDTAQKGFYVQDKWQAHSRLSINYGIRFDNQSSRDSYNIERFKAWTVNPRFGVAFRLNKDGRDVIRASWGRYSDIVYVQSAPSFGNRTPEIKDEWDNDLNGTWETQRITPAIGFGTEPAPQTGLNRTFVNNDLSPSYEDEWHIGYTRQLPWKMVFDAGYIQASIKNTTGTFDTNIIYENGFFVGYRDVNFNSLSEIRNLKNFSLDFKSLQFSLVRNIGSRFSVFTNYTYQIQTRNGTWAYDEVNGYLHPADWFKDDKLQRPHIFRFNGDVRIPWGFKLSAIYSLHSGSYGGSLTKVLATTDPEYLKHVASVTLSNGRIVNNPLRTTSRLIGPRSEGRLQTPNLPRLNLRLGKDFRLPKESQVIETAVDFFNITNNATPMFFNNSTRPDLATFGTYTSFVQSPRGAQISIRYRF